MQTLHISIKSFENHPISYAGITLEAFATLTFAGIHIMPEQQWHGKDLIKFHKVYLYYRN